MLALIFGHHTSRSSCDSANDPGHSAAGDPVVCRGSDGDQVPGIGDPENRVALQQESRDEAPGELLEQLVLELSA
jgi:hypothetical protein